MIVFFLNFCTFVLELSKETHRYYLFDFKIKLHLFDSMNVYLFWILFLALWALVPLMIIKGRKEETSKLNTSQEVKANKKGWFN